MSRRAVSLTAKKAVELTLLTAAWMIVGTVSTWRQRTEARMVEQVKDGRMSMDQAALVRGRIKRSQNIWVVGMGLLTLCYVLQAIP